MVDLNLGDTRLIIEECRKQGVLRNQAAYVLATAFWETARTMEPVREYGGEKYLKSKRYYPYVGMGYVQLTWRTNYEKASDKLGVDFVSDPRKLLKPEYAKTILILGMVEGWFTGKSLSDYITLQKSDFINARRIINGVDRKREIAEIAKDYDHALVDIGYGVTSDGTSNIPPVYPKPKPKPPAVEVLPAPPPKTKQTFLSILAALIGRLFNRS
ncbi:MAG: hypothetical protein ABJO09_00915 [Hyphomicrobiales bacterium]